MRALTFHARQKQIVIKTVPKIAPGQTVNPTPRVLMANPLPRAKNTITAVAMLLPALVPLPKHAVMDIMGITIIPTPVRNAITRNQTVRLIVELPRTIIVLGRQQSQQENIMNLAQKVSRTALSVNTALVAQTSIAALPQILK
jgi:bifunctional DNA-binding transcriptional regulator/antitoxin component of YhaV-PrlF toxin-antitoxin module